MAGELSLMNSIASGLGIPRIQHAGQSYLEHLAGVYNGLLAWGYDHNVCRAGFFHSIYGTERFRDFALPLSRRKELRERIGEWAEDLAFMNCSMPRKHMDSFVLSGSKSKGEKDLLAVHLADWLDQVPLCGEWEYRKGVYESIANQLGGPALETFRWVYRGRL